jgi:Holliday junction DNA helicase RuvA
MSTFYELPPSGAEIQLFTHLLVREDALLLYGFATEAERRLFRGLLKVSGVGPRIALGLLSGISVEGFLRCVEAEDADSLVRIPGIGRKTAERLLIEMRDRVGNLEGAPGQARTGAAGSTHAEAFSALVALGYKPPEVARLLKAADGSNGTVEDLIRRALQAAAKD